MIRLAVTGAGGRMGRTIIQAIRDNPTTELACAIEHRDSGFIGKDAGEVSGAGHLGVPVESDWTERKFDVLIEFTGPRATVDHARYCLDAGGRMVIGTTGLSDSDKNQILALSDNMAVVLAPNMSVGVNLCFHLVELAARTLGDDVDIEIVEAHHRHKVDSPSGTALRLGEIAAAAVGSNLDEHAIYGRHGQVGPRQRKTIGFSTIRGGDIVGDHSVLFAGEGERVEITHRSSSRMTFANGAVRAALWCMQHDRGLFDMQDVLGLNPNSH